MCRMFAISSGVKLDLGMRMMLMESLAVRSLGDDNQAFGVGVSDGTVVTKSGKSAIQVPVIQWLLDLDPGETWFGHLRKPSKGVEGAATAASHPFMFKDSGLVAAHNGFVADVLPAAPQKGTPYVDSYYALKLLSDQLIGQQMSMSIVEEWVSKFGPGTQYTFMFKHRRDLWIIRGVRPMCIATLNGGYVCATSADALFSLMEVTQNLWSQYFDWGKKVQFVDDYTAIHIPFDGRMRAHKIKTTVPEFPDVCVPVRESLK